MRTTPLPTRRYTLALYPNVDPAKIGRVIPIGYGTLTGIVPVEIDTTAHKWKILDQAIDELTAVRSATKDPLDITLDYTEDLALAEFTILKNETLWPAVSYNFRITGDYTINGTDYAAFGKSTDGLYFVIYGKTTIDAAEQVLYSSAAWDEELGFSNLRDSIMHLGISQSFTIAAQAYVTKIALECTIVGDPVGNARVQVYDDDWEQIGPDGTWCEVPANELTIPERNENEALTVDVKAPSPELQKGDDILSDVIVTVLGKSASLLDATELATLETYRPQDLKVYIDEETTFGDFVGKLESGQMWKFVPLQDGTYGTIVYENGEPAGTPHFYDHDFLSFRMELDNSYVKQAVTVAYDQDEGTRDYSYTRASSDIAKFFYLNEDSVEIETFLETSTDADELAEDYLTRYQQPITKVIFEVHGWALELLPGRDKVKLTRTRAAYAGGTLAGVLFRIIKLVKKPETNVVEITAARWGNDEGDERTVASPILGAFSLPAPTVEIT